ncbi:hypothetical protein DCAR_0934439 [Daucus carota subsp. sativus]|uniref:Endonuclease/exonuclease/phosphatase domain-containing protein n=1 Tax=Daucus carota subsp. sativus TaxID=79200 RepID=A0AAF0XVF8_DAUCS|nr:hypothetical protein DCAR_0934439 [Daucus carota subsp. sativus]
MNCATWNVRGLNKRSHQKEALHFVDSNHLSFVGFMETKVKVQNMSKVVNRIKRNLSWVSKHADHYNGRIIIGWDAAIWTVSVLNSSPQHVTCRALFKENNSSFVISFIYAFNDGCDRVPRWNFISSYSVGESWCLAGDFNTVLSISEILGVVSTGHPRCKLLKTVWLMLVSLVFEPLGILLPGQTEGRMTWC